jgi:hypothetical protein
MIDRFRKTWNGLLVAEQEEFVKALMTVLALAEVALCVFYPFWGLAVIAVVAGVFAALALWNVVVAPILNVMLRMVRR